MKKITKLGLAVTVFMATAVFNSAMAQEKTIYGYSYSKPVTKYSEIKRFIYPTLLQVLLTAKTITIPAQQF